MASVLLAFGNHLMLDRSRWGNRGCILCRRADRYGDSKFCYTCDIATKVLAPIVVPVPEDNETYNNGTWW